MRFLDDASELVSRFFSRREASAFAKLSPEEKPGAFFNLWTRKEALLKAVGMGIGSYLNQVEVSFLRGEEPKLMALPSQAGHADEWSVRSGEPAVGFVSAVVCQGVIKELKCWCWPESPVPSRYRGEAL